MRSPREEEIPLGLAARAPGGYLPDFFFDLRDVGEDEEDHEQRERGQHPAPELQLHGGVGALRDPRAGRGQEQGLEEPPRSTRSGAHTLRSGRVRAGGGRGDSGSDRQGLLRRGEPARSLSSPACPSPPLPSLLLFSPPFSRPTQGSGSSLTALLRGSPGLLPLTPAASHPPFLLPSGRVQGACHSRSKKAGLGPWKATWRLNWLSGGGERGTGHNSEHQGWLAGKRPPLPALCQHPCFLSKFSRHKDEHLGTVSSARQGGGFLWAMFQQLTNWEGKWKRGGEKKWLRQANFTRDAHGNLWARCLVCRTPPALWVVIFVQLQTQAWEPGAPRVV